MELKPCILKLPFPFLLARRVAAAFLAPSFRALATSLICFDHILTSSTGSNICLAISMSAVAFFVRILNVSDGGLETFVVPFPV